MSHGSWITCGSSKSVEISGLSGVVGVGWGFNSTGEVVVGEGIVTSSMGSGVNVIMYSRKSNLCGGPYVDVVRRQMLSGTLVSVGETKMSSNVSNIMMTLSGEDWRASEFLDKEDV